MREFYRFTHHRLSVGVTLDAKYKK
jgi:hypothetical protein